MRLTPEAAAVHQGSTGGGFRVLASQPGMLALILLAGLTAIGAGSKK